MRGGGFILHAEAGRPDYQAGPASIISPECSPSTNASAEKISFRLSKPISVDDEFELKFKENDAVDFKHSTKCWVKSKVKAIDNINNSTQLTIAFENELFKINFPSPEFNARLKQCGIYTDKSGCASSNSSNSEFKIPKLDPLAMIDKESLECNS